MANIYFIGDSNILFFKQALEGGFNISGNSLEEKSENFIETMGQVWEGYDKKIFRGHSLHFLWRSAFPASRVNPIFLKEIIEKQKIILGQNDILILQFGRVDLELKIKTTADIDKLMRRYIEKSLNFAEVNNTKLYFMTPIIHADIANDKLKKYFTESMSDLCIQNNLSKPIDIFNAISDQFQYLPWDENKHLDVQESIIGINFVLNSVLEANL